MKSAAEMVSLLWHQRILESCSAPLGGWNWWAHRLHRLGRPGCLRCLAGRVACAVVIGIDVDVGILEVVILWCQVDIVGSSSGSGHCCCVKALVLLSKRSFSFSSLQILRFDLAGVVGFVVFRFCRYFESAYWRSFSVCILLFWKRVCSLRVVYLWLNLRFFAVDERRMSSFLTFGLYFWRGRASFSSVSFTSLWVFPLLFQNVVQGAGFRKNRCTPVWRKRCCQVLIEFITDDILVTHY